ncbi:MAG: HAD family hydrolase [Halanaeroarchaeum sp.]
MHVVFDLDGVLLDSESDLSWLDRGLDGALSECGVAATAENRARLFPPTRERLTDLAAEVGVSVETCWEIRNRHYTEAKLAAIRSGAIGPYPNVDVIAEMAGRYPLAIVSNSPQAVVDAFVEQAGLAEHFEYTVGRGTTLADVERLKPHPHLYERLHAHTAADDYVYVGDEDSDGEFASATGMAFVHLDRERGPVDSLAAVRDRVAALA